MIICRLEPESLHTDRGIVISKILKRQNGRQQGLEFFRTVCRKRSGHPLVKRHIHKKLKESRAGRPFIAQHGKNVIKVWTRGIVFHCNFLCYYLFHKLILNAGCTFRQVELSGNPRFESGLHFTDELCIGRVASQIVLIRNLVGPVIKFYRHLTVF